MERECVCDVPERVLARCEADRRIIALARDAEDEIAAYQRDGEAGPSFLHGSRQALQAVLILHAGEFADHPEFDPAWRPDPQETP